MAQMTENERKQQAQVEYCVMHNLPVFAPKNGRCPSCLCNIYEYLSEYEVACKQITYCPRCHMSFLA